VNALAVQRALAPPIHEPKAASVLPTTRPLSGFLSPKLRKQRHRPTSSQILLKPEGDVFVAGSDSTQQLLALCHAAESDPVPGGPVSGMDRARNPAQKEKPPACAGGSCSCSRVAAYLLA
jgi:hypothetical protein